MPSISRRDVLHGLAGLSAVGLAGCASDGGGGGGNGSGGNGSGGGGGGGGTTRIGVGIPSAGTTTGAASNSFQRVVENVSADTEPAGTLRWNNQETGGDPPSLRQFDAGNIQAMTGGNFIIASAKQDLPPFQKKAVGSIPHQAFSITALHMHILAVEGSGIETTDDLVGKNFWPLPPQWGLRQQAETVLKNAGLWSELQDSGSVVNADTGDVAGAISEERIDAIVAYGAGGANLAGWATEVDARANLHLVKMTDSFQQGVESTRGTSFSEIKPYGWENQEFEADTMDVYGADFQFWFGPGISRDAGYELAKISSENVESIQEGQPAYADHSDPANMASLYLDDHPVHAGVYDFLKEQGVDVSGYTRGEVQG
ncbi:TAXI family TRAP transporter solute-binding subunit [Halomarina litorea]|uniref:TAXI family TRAP transporter solute-binding subunit n=1 Tax=Halomarina litorea TaxID=2961595 RepID=UPI0020C49D33|nr:TAXI family TRAP transporter solute-binding subunit [Halomarina sp. BCD28]